MASSAAAIRASAARRHLVVWPTLDRGARLAYAVLPRVPAGFPSAPRVIVDAQTGEILQARDMVHVREGERVRVQPDQDADRRACFDLALTPGGADAHERLHLERRTASTRRRSGPSTCSASRLNVHVCDIVQIATANAERRLRLRACAMPPGAIEVALGRVLRGVDVLPRGQGVSILPRRFRETPDAQVVVDKPLRLIANLQIPAGIDVGRLLAKAADPEHRRSRRSRTRSSRRRAAGSARSSSSSTASRAARSGSVRDRSATTRTTATSSITSSRTRSSTPRSSSRHGTSMRAARSTAPGAMNEGLADYFSSAITGDPDVGEYASTDISQNASVDPHRSRTRTSARRPSLARCTSTPRSSPARSGRRAQSLPEADRSKFDAAHLQGDAHQPRARRSRLRRPREAVPRDAGDRSPGGRDGAREGDDGARVLPSCERILRFEGRGRRSRRGHQRIGFARAWQAERQRSRAIAPGIIQVRAALRRTRSR